MFRFKYRYVCISAVTLPLILLCTAMPYAVAKAQSAIMAEPLSSEDFGSDLQEYTPPPMFLDNVSYSALARTPVKDMGVHKENLIVSVNIPDELEPPPVNLKAIAESDNEGMQANEIKVFEVTVREGNEKERSEASTPVPAPAPVISAKTKNEKTVSTVAAKLEKPNKLMHQASFTSKKESSTEISLKEDLQLEQKIVDANIEDILKQIDEPKKEDKGKSSAQEPVRYFDGAPVRVAAIKEASRESGLKLNAPPQSKSVSQPTPEKMARVLPDAPIQRDELPEVDLPARDVALSGNTRVEPEASQFDSKKPITVHFRPETLEAEMFVQGAMIQDILLRLGVDASKKHLELVSYTNTQVLSAKEARRLSYLRGRALKDMLSQYHINPDQISIRALSAHNNSVAETDRIEIVFRDIIG